MENLVIKAMPFADTYQNQRVLVTGHTGFKGSWLSEWLLMTGAQVCGISLCPPSRPSMFEQLGLEGRVIHHQVDIRDAEAVKRVVADFKPTFIFHLAAQSLVRKSYQDPIETYSTNVLGTAHVLEAARQAGRQCTVIAVTTDKCYENREWLYGYREDDPMGGHDPYSSSKGAAELVISGYRRSYFSSDESPVRLASARAGNVIGGGDWAVDRILPDCIRALERAEKISVRNRHATRPWQHVLDPLSGYLHLAAEIHRRSRASDSTHIKALCSAFNFGPTIDANRSVGNLVQEVLKHWPGEWEDRANFTAPHEAKLLNLSIEKAFHILNWEPVWDFENAVERTVKWYHQTKADDSLVQHLTRNQIRDYVTAAQAKGLLWAQAD